MARMDSTAKAPLMMYKCIYCIHSHHLTAVLLHHFVHLIPAPHFHPLPAVHRHPPEYPLL